MGLVGLIRSFSFNKLVKSHHPITGFDIKRIWIKPRHLFCSHGHMGRSRNRYLGPCTYPDMLTYLPTVRFDTSWTLPRPRKANEKTSFKVMVYDFFVEICGCGKFVSKLFKEPLLFWVNGIFLLLFVDVSIYNSNSDELRNPYWDGTKFIIKREI